MSSSAPHRTTPLPCGPDVPLPQLLHALEGWLYTSDPCWLQPGTVAAPLTGVPADAPAHALIVATTGSTGAAKRTVLGRDAVLAAIAATHARLGGPGAWLHTLPAHYIAGLMVLLRAVVGGTSVHPCPRPLDRIDVTVTQRPPGPCYISLVPTQLADLSQRPSSVAALATLDAVLVGGAPLPPHLRRTLLAAQVPLIATYGASETAGGCVYNGAPLPGTTVRLDDDQRILLSGPSLAAGYLRPTAAGLEWSAADTAAAFPQHQGERVWRTQDLGTIDTHGVLQVTGRLDDVIMSGAVKVWPAEVEAALQSCFPHLTAVVVGVPDARWGQRVTALLAVSSGVAPRLEDVRAQLRAHTTLPDAALPHAVLPIPALPLLPSGKPDRLRLAAYARTATT